MRYRTSRHDPQLDYQRVERAILYLEENHLDQPSLRDTAAAVGLSSFHFQRIFRRWAGISPKRFLQFLTVGHARTLLRESRPVLETAYASGLSGPGRLHDLFVTVEAMTPGEYGSGGEGLRVRHGVHPSPFGPVSLALTERGICALGFLEESSPDDPGDPGGPGNSGGTAGRGRPGGPADARGAAELRRRWPRAELVEDRAATGALVRRIFSPGGCLARNPGAHAPDAAAGAAPVPEAPAPLRLLLGGTNFQIKVWEALLRIPPGAVCTYGDIASALGRPSASRAVGAAVGGNAVAYLIPCHRVIRSTGAFGEYRWGRARKRAMLAWERAHLSQGENPSGSAG